MACNGLGKRLRDIESATLVSCSQNVLLSLATSSDTFQDIYTLQVQSGAAVRVEIELDCRISDGTGWASFRRTGLFYRESGDVQIVQFWHTVHTIRSSVQFDVKYILNPTDILFQVKSSSSVVTNWKGCAHIYEVS